MLRDPVPADFIKVIHGGVQTYRPGNVRGASFEFMGSVLPSARLEINADDHLPAALVRRHVFKHLAPAIKNSDASRSAHFVPGKREEIATDFLHINQAMTGALSRIHQGRKAQVAG